MDLLWRLFIRFCMLFGSGHLATVFLAGGLCSHASLYIRYQGGLMRDEGMRRMLEERQWLSLA